MSKVISDAFVVSAVRTPVGKAPRGFFRKTRPDDLLAHVLRGAVEPIKDKLHLIDDVIVGCAMPEAEQGMNVARIGLLLAGVPMLLWELRKF
jgi:acetyl-CoA acyltransferase